LHWRSPLAEGANVKTWIATSGLLFAMLWSNAIGAATTTVVDLAVGSHTQRFLYVRPDAPVANIVYLSGGDGVLDIQPDGTMGDFDTVKCGPLVRLRQQFADQKFSVALVDRNSVGDLRAFADVNEVIRHMQGRDNVPTWLIGGSSSTGAAMTLGAQLPAASPVGIVIFSPAGQVFTAADAASVTRPIEIVYNPLDTPQSATRLLSELTAATIKSLVTLNGGTSQGCGHHTFAGQDDEFVAAVTGFINQYNGTISPPPPGLLVVEYHNSDFDHYFITPVTAEIALLDAHAPPFQAWSRTGFSFNAYPNVNAPAGSVAICRFFNTSFAPKSSHFYAAHGFGCEATLALFPDWGLEDDKLFNTMLPDAGGNCPAGTIPVYRLYNHGMGGAPNHRFVTSLVERQKMLDQGYDAEGNGIGVGMCAPGP
jgi:Repeat of unknown function (DUF5648)